jgi:hypothetical protein
MIKRKILSPPFSRLTTRSARAEIASKSRPDWSDKNGLATGRKNRREAVFAFVGL